MPLDPSKIEAARAWRRDRENARLQESLTHSANFEPAQQRRADLAATDLDVSLDIATTNLADAERISEARQVPDAAQLREESPKTAEWLSDPRRARFSSDDIKGFQAYEKYSNRPVGVNPITNSINFAKQSLNQMTGSYLQLAGQAWEEMNEDLRGRLQEHVDEKGLDIPVRTLSDLKVFDGMGPDEALKYAGTAVREGDVGYVPINTLDEMLDNPSVKQIAATALEQGPGSLIQMLAVRGNMPLYAASLAMTMANENARQQGKEEADMGDFIDAVPFALASASLERIGAGKVLGIAAKKPARFTAAYAVKETLKASGTETFTEGLQNPIEYLGGIAGTDAEIDYTEMARQAIGGAILGGVIGGSLRTTTLPIQALRQRSQDTLELHVKSAIEQQNLDAQLDSIETLKLYQESPERAAQFLKDAGGDTKIFITPEELVLAAEEGLPVPKYLLEEAQGTADVEMTVDKFAMEILGSEELTTRLRPHMKRSADTLTQSEIKNRDNSGLDKLLRKATEDSEVRSEAEVIHDTYTAQLVATGRMNKETAKIQAAWIPAYVTTKVANERARGNDLSVAKVFEMMNMVIEPKKGTTQKPSNAPDPARSAEIIEAEARESAKDSVILNQESGEPIRLYVDTEADVQTGDVDIEPTYLTDTAVEGDPTDSSYVDLRNPLVVDGTKEDPNVSWDPQELKDLKDRGYDGVWIKSPEGDRVIAFDPIQVLTVPKVGLDQTPVRDAPQIQAEISTYEKLLACIKAA